MQGAYKFNLNMSMSKIEKYFDQEELNKFRSEPTQFTQPLSSKKMVLRVTEILDEI